MMITRDIVQGFIDGHKIAGHSKECVKKCLLEYLRSHHTYPTDESTAEKIVSDVESYRH